MAGTHQQRCAVFVDGSAIFFACRSLFPTSQLKYDNLVELLLKNFGQGSDVPKNEADAKLLLAPGASASDRTASLWIMWTAAVAENEGQARFLEFIERKLKWAVRTFSPSDSLLVDPHSTLSISTESSLADRLTRFDSSISYMIGRVAETHQIIAITDSFGIAEPLVRAAKARKDSNIGQPSPPNVLAFFGRAVDPRWHGVLRKDQYGSPNGALQFLDLDQSVDALFGVRKTNERAWWTDDIPSAERSRRS